MTSINAQNFDIKKLSAFEEKLEDVMEIIEIEKVKSKLIEVEKQFDENPNELNKLRLGLIYHETAFNLTFIDKTREYNGYANKSYEILTKLANSNSTTIELMPIIQSYRASALSLVSSETKKLSLLGKAFDIFEVAIKEYAQYSPRPEFLRGSVSENLPFFMWKKRSFAKRDFASIIEKQEQNNDYADFSVMSFSYWAWANQHQGKKYREKALIYLDRAIQIDSNYQAGRKKAEELKLKFMQK